MANSNGSCWSANDVVASTLGRVGITRSLLVTLALLPYAWAGLEWCAGAVRSLWNLVASV